MSIVIGVDTSNYTTSFAALDTKSGELVMEKKLLPVKPGELGLRQSDAVFHHVAQLGELAGRVLDALPKDARIEAVGVSAWPRRVEGSYMPCFLVGQLAADLLCGALRVPKYEFSHQEGHVAAALYSAGKVEWLSAPFYAFHVSGGTTELLSCTPDEKHLLSVERVGGTLDLNAGQAVDRVGGMLGLSFPAGPQLERLAFECEETIPTKPVLKGLDCCLSGLQNQCEKLLEQGRTPAYTAKFCLQMISDTLAGMTRRLLKTRQTRPILYAGGVMSNAMIRKRLEGEFGGVFAEPRFSADNAAGTALLAALAHARTKEESLPWMRTDF